MNIDKNKLSKEITDKYSIVSNAFRVKAKDNPKDLLVVEIGDIKQPDFYPQLKIGRLGDSENDNECNVSIRLKDNEVGVEKVETKADKIVWSKGNLEAHFYDLTNEEHPEGASEFEITLKEKPASNVIEFTLVDKDVDYFYQPPLTQQEIDEGASRPENVVGSYAVYAKTPKTNWTGGKEYRCGKVGHIYRPKIIDSAGTEVWGELLIENGILSVTIPQDFLDKAVYPVRHAAGLTFGYTGAGAIQVYGISADEFIGGLYATAAGTTGYTIDSLTTSVVDGGDGGGDIKAVVTNSSKVILTNGVGGVVAVTGSKAWKTATYTTKPTVAASTSYYLGYVSSYGMFGGGPVQYGDNTGTNIVDGSNSYTTPTNPTDGSSAGNYKLSIYATYTAAASGPANLKSLDTNLKANIKSYNTNLIANIKSINTNI